MSKLYSTKSNRLPSKGDPGDVYFATDVKETFIVLGDGRLFSLPVLLSGAHVVPAVGPKGEPGTSDVPVIPSVGDEVTFDLLEGVAEGSFYAVNVQAV
jgi:hypothetical protein